MKARTLLPVVAIALLVSCAHQPVETESYTYRGGVSGGDDLDVTLDNLVESSEDRTYLLWLNAVRMRDNNWEGRYYLEVRYEGASDAGYIDIPPGETLILDVDGAILRFRGIGSEETRQRTGRGHFVENALYETDAQTIRRIAKAQSVKIQVNGENRKLYREFDSENTLRFRNFVLNHMGGF